MNRSQLLHVYECLGNGLPRREPAVQGYLGLWPEPPYYYFFFNRCAREEMKGWLAHQDGWVLRDVYEIDYDNWQQLPSLDQRIGPFLVCMEALRPSSGVETGRTVSRGLHARASHKEAGGSIPLFLNPGLVFGSGLHPTTRGCLEAIAELFKRDAPDTVVDFGTGTGILAIACRLLGAPSVRAVDCIPMAIQVARDNARLNGLEGRLDFLVAQDLTIFNGASDLLLMNIEWPCLQNVLRSPDWQEYRRIVLSGFLDTQWEDLQRLLPATGRDIRYDAHDGWGTVVLGPRID